MPTIADIRQQYPQYNDMSDQQLADALYQKHYSDMPREQYDAKIGMAKQPETASGNHARIGPETVTLGDRTGIDQPKAQDRGSFDAATQSVAAGLFGGFDDEIMAGAISPIEATKNWVQGKGFDLGKAYTDLQSDFDSEKQQRRQQHPVASVVGELSGGLATGGTLAKGGLTLAGKGLLPAAAEGGAYGAVYGAGEAKPGERLTGALTGGAVGALTGGAMEKVGQAIGNRIAQKPLAAARKNMPAKTSEELGVAASGLYDQLRQSGAVLPKQAANKAATNIDLLLRKTNKELAPNAFGLKQSVDNILKGGDVDIVEWHNLSKQINRVSRGNLGGDDKYYVGLIKKQIDSLRDGRVKGPASAMKQWKQANDLTLRQKKVEIVERALDLADLDTGQYTQSELAGTIAKRFRAIYRSDDISAFTKAEKQIIRDIGQAKSQSSIVNLVKKLAPRGVVSASAGGLIGNMLMGPAGVVIAPAMGEAAQRMANRATQNAAQTFVGDVSRGITPVANGRNVLLPVQSGFSGVIGQEGSARLPRQ